MWFPVSGLPYEELERSHRSIKEATGKPTFPESVSMKPRKIISPKLVRATREQKNPSIPELLMRNADLMCLNTWSPDGDVAEPFGYRA